MSGRLVTRLVTPLVAAAALLAPATTASAFAAGGMPIPLPDPKPRLHLFQLPPQDLADLLRELRAEYAATHLPRVHTEIVLIVNNPASAVL